MIPGRSPLEGFLERFAAELGSKLGTSDALGLPPDSKNELLELARDVAHGTERKNAPLAAFIAGGYVFARVADGVDSATAIREVTGVASSMLSSEGGPG